MGQLERMFEDDEDKKFNKTLTKRGLTQPPFPGIIYLENEKGGEGGSLEAALRDETNNRNPRGFKYQTRRHYINCHCKACYHRRRYAH